MSDTRFALHAGFVRAGSQPTAERPTYQLVLNVEGWSQAAGWPAGILMVAETDSPAEVREALRDLRSQLTALLESHMLNAGYDDLVDVATRPNPKEEPQMFTSQVLYQIAKDDPNRHDLTDLDGEELNKLDQHLRRLQARTAEAIIQRSAAAATADEPEQP